MNYRDFNDYELINLISENNEDAHNILIKKYEPLINKIASKMIYFCKGTGIDKSDLIQEGMIGLNHAINQYHEQKNILFYTYAKSCIERKMISVVIAAKRNKNKILNESISYDDEDNSLIKVLKDSSPNPEEVVISADIKENLIGQAKNNLTDFENQVFDLLILGFKYKEISLMLNKDQKSIDNAIQRIKSKLKSAL